MVGICGVFGRPEHSIDRMKQKLKYTGSEYTENYSDKNAQIGIALFSKSVENQPINLGNDKLFWAWGDIYGHEKDGEYISKERKDIDDAEYFSELYKKNGLNILKDLNGEFAGILYNKKNKSISLISDKLGTHPIYYTITDDGNLVFSTQIQSLPYYPSVETSFHLKYLSQFLIFERVLGCKTPLKEVYQIHPGSILIYETSSCKPQTKIYWGPHYERKKRNFSETVDEYIEILTRIIEDRFNNDLSYGFYLSGGNDSRLLLSIIKKVYPDINLICYHMNEWMNKEAKISKQVANELGFEFRFLERDKNYQLKVLEESSTISIFNSWFDHAHGVGFKDKLKNEVDVMIDGSYSNTILEQGKRCRKELYLPFLEESIALPFFEDINSIDELISYFLEGRWGRLGLNSEDINGLDKQRVQNYLKSEIHMEKNEISCFGVNFNSFEDFYRSFYFYPLTNTFSYLNYYSDLQMFPSTYPFIDSRLVNFFLTLPDSYLMRNKVINSSIKKINPSVGGIKNANSDLPVKYPLIFHILNKKINSTKSTLFQYQKEKREREKSWGNVGEIIRKTDFVKNKIYENEELIKKCPFLEFDKVLKYYNGHMEGKNHKNELFSILTFFENPLTKKLLSG